MKLRTVIIALQMIIISNLHSQDATNLGLDSEEMVSMNDASVVYGGEMGQRYYKRGSKKPYTGWLCARYDNGELEAAQQFVDGYGNGIWINYDPDGRKTEEGTYKNNETVGPAKLFYEDGSVKASGDFIHRYKKVGWWNFYDREGNLVSKRFFTR